MHCPLDGTTLVLTERSGIEIDHCPMCQGVWLDRGELATIIDRADPDGGTRPKRKRTSFLGELFEFGG